MASTVSPALAAVQRYVDAHSAEFIMSLHTAAAQLGDNQRLPRRLLADVRQLIESPNFCEELAAHIADSCPGRLAELFHRDVQVCRRFCKSRDRVIAWFQHFNASGLRHFEKGARSIANFALKHRTDMWDLLCWKRRAWPPTVVANRPDHFCELDVPATIQALLHDCPHFFESLEFQQACNDPQWVASSPEFFITEAVAFIDPGSSGASGRAEQLLAHLMEHADRPKCLAWCLSHLPPDAQADAITQCLPSKYEVRLRDLPENYTHAQDWLVFGAVRWPTRRQLLAAYVCCCRAGTLLPRIRRDAPDLWRQLVASGAAAAAVFDALGRDPLPDGLAARPCWVRCGADAKALSSQLADAVAWAAWCADTDAWRSPQFQRTLTALHWALRPAAPALQPPPHAIGQADRPLCTTVSICLSAHPTLRDHACSSGDDDDDVDPLLVMAEHRSHDRHRRKSRSRKRRRRPTSPQPPPSPSPAAAAEGHKTHAAEDTADAPAANSSATLARLASLQVPVVIPLGRGGEAVLTAAELVRCVAVAGILVATVRDGVRSGT